MCFSLFLFSPSFFPLWLPNMLLLASAQILSAFSLSFATLSRSLKAWTKHMRWQSSYPIKSFNNPMINPHCAWRCISLCQSLWYPQIFSVVSSYFFLSLFSLFNLYNLLENPYSRFFVYLKSLSLVTHGKVIEHILPSIRNMDNFLKEWNLGVKDQRELFLAISNILKEIKG